MGTIWGGESGDNRGRGEWRQWGRGESGHYGEGRVVTIG